MVLGPLAVVFALVGIDYGVWNWPIAGADWRRDQQPMTTSPLRLARSAWPLACGTAGLVLGARPARSIRLATSARARHRDAEPHDAERPRDRLAA